MADWDPTKQTYADYLIRSSNGGTSPFPGDQPAAAPAPAAPASPSLDTDPTFLAFQRALGAQKDAYGNQAQTQKEALQRGLADQLPGIARSGEYQRENISGGFETRGMLRSGQHEQTLARQRQSEADRVAALRSNEANGEAGLNAGLSQQYADLDRQLAEQRLGAAQRQQEHDDNQSLQNQLSGLQTPTIDGGLGAAAPAPAALPAAPGVPTAADLPHQLALLQHVSGLLRR